MRFMHMYDLRWIAAIGLTAVVLTTAGCETSGSGNRSAREVALAEFSRAPEGTTERERAPTVPTETAEPEREDATPESPADASGLPQLGAGPSSEDAWFGPEPGTRIIVDSLVGQVNGRPIYADTFFQPIRDQLRAIARRTTQREFLEQAQEVITQHL